MEVTTEDITYFDAKHWPLWTLIKTSQQNNKNFNLSHISQRNTLLRLQDLLRFLNYVRNQGNTLQSFSIPQYQAMH